jgi:flagellar biosynthesis/type III secretory pathway ATPase
VSVRIVVWTDLDCFRWRGTITNVTGFVIESQGPASKIGGFCEIQAANGRTIRTQVIGFRNGRILSMPLEEIDGLEPGDPIYARSDDAQLTVGPGLLGRVLDGFGKPIDGGPPIAATAKYNLYAALLARSTVNTSKHRWSPAFAPLTVCFPAASVNASGSLAAAVWEKALCSVLCRGKIPLM